MSVGGGNVVVEVVGQWPVSGGVGGRGGNRRKEAGQYVGRGFGGHGGDRWKVSGRRAMASVETVETEARWLKGME